MKQSFRRKVCEYIKEEYHGEPERLWRRFPDYLVIRHTDNHKWYALIMDVPADRLGLSAEGRVDILNVKMDDPMLADIMIRRDGIVRGYHISRGNWISILLDGTVPFDEIKKMIDVSYLATASGKTKKKSGPPKEWLIPSNPKYYDIVHAFDGEEVIDWKQGRGISAGDTVYLYVAAPVSSVLYQCRVLETDIPYSYSDGNLSIRALMKIRLLKRYEPGRFSFDILKKRYGIYAVRGPRSVPHSLSEALKET